MCGESFFHDLTGKNQALAGKAGGIDAVVAVMRAHVGNAGVSMYACWAIRSICFDGAFASGAACVFACLFGWDFLQRLSFADAGASALVELAG